jgi:hypothetical protein
MPIENVSKGNSDGTSLGQSATDRVGMHGVVAAQDAAIATPASPGASYAQAEVVALRTAIASILVALRNKGIIAT